MLIFARKRGYCGSLLCKKTNQHEKTAAELPENEKIVSFSSYSAAICLFFVFVFAKKLTRISFARNHAKKALFLGLSGNTKLAYWL